MKKYILRLLALLTCAVLLVGCGTEKDERNFDEGGEKETENRSEVSVYCMTEYIYTYEDQQNVYAVSYEEDGVHLTPKSVSPAGECYSYVYGWDGRLLLERLVDEDGAEISRSVLSYDKNGSLSEKSYTYHPDNSTTRRIYEYDNQGKIARVCSYSKSGKVSSIYAYSYDERGFLTECLVTGYQDVPQWRYAYTCDEEGTVVAGQRYVLSEDIDPVGLQSNLIYSYDEAGRILSLVWEPIIESNKLRESKYYTYDETGRMIGYRVFHQEISLVEDKTFTYDGEGFLIAAVDAEGARREFVYGQLTVDSQLADGAQQWSTAGAIDAYTPSADTFIK